MAYAKACSADELWEGDMVEVDVNEHVVVLVWPTGGEIHAYQGICPHQDIPLADAAIDAYCGALPDAPGAAEKARTATRKFRESLGL